MDSKRRFSAHGPVSVESPKPESIAFDKKPPVPYKKDDYTSTGIFGQPDQKFSRLKIDDPAPTTMDLSWAKKYDEEADGIASTDYSPLIKQSTRKVLVLYTGGTMGMIRRADGSYVPSPTFMRKMLQYSSEFATRLLPETVFKCEFSFSKNALISAFLIVAYFVSRINNSSCACVR